MQHSGCWLVLWRNSQNVAAAKEMCTQDTGKNVTQHDGTYLPFLQERVLMITNKAFPTDFRKCKRRVTLNLT
jgi:hypothetical protein